MQGSKVIYSAQDNGVGDIVTLANLTSTNTGIIQITVDPAEADTVDVLVEGSLNGSSFGEVVDSEVVVADTTAATEFHYYRIFPHMRVTVTNALAVTWVVVTVME
jgi:hypothetical protein